MERCRRLRVRVDGIVPVRAHHVLAAVAAVPDAWHQHAVRTILKSGYDPPRGNVGVAGFRSCDLPGDRRAALPVRLGERAVT